MKDSDLRFFDVLYSRRSVRKFTPEPVPVEVLEAIVQAGLKVPTGCNAQLRQYMIITDPAVMNTVSHDQQSHRRCAGGHRAAHRAQTHAMGRLPPAGCRRLH